MGASGGWRGTKSWKDEDDGGIQTEQLEVLVVALVHLNNFNQCRFTSMSLQASLSRVSV